ncbi:MAG: FAD:protein FMN transferase [Desulfobulbaceae bacterium]|nr:FAD:protein FMN transferase [Desulfobulbaceae bacterium]HIJ79916.1 FAD:protein FMN transferase [Deltaproteobacteria bacterium]
MQEERGNNNGLNRRRFLQIFAVAGAAGALGFLPFTPEKSGLQVIRKSRPMMGTFLNLIVYARDKEQAAAAVAATFKRMEELESKLSRHQAASEVSRLNQSGFLDNPGPELQAVLELAQAISRKTSGAFDITILPLLTLYQQQGQALLAQQSLIDGAVKAVGQAGLAVSHQRLELKKSGMGITLDGIGKGYIVDQGVATLGQFGFDQVYVEAGGDLLVKGGKPRGNPWLIGIRNPRPEMARQLVTIEAETMAVATSGDYYQPFSPDLLHHHIINPHTGFSPPELASCTITAPDAALADALATGCMVLGAADSIDLLAGLPDCEGYFIHKDLTTRKTEGFAART